MANEYKLSYTATQIDKKLGKIDSLEAEIQNLPSVYVGSEEPDSNATVWIDHNGRNVNLVVAPATAEVGQTIVVKTVDENGKPTAWEAVDFPSGCGFELVGEWKTEEDVTKFTATLDEQLTDSYYILFQFAGTATNTKRYKPIIYINGSPYRYLDGEALYNNNTVTVWACGQLLGSLPMRFELQIGTFMYGEGGKYQNFNASGMMGNTVFTVLGHYEHISVVESVGFVADDGGTFGVGSGVRIYRIKGV
jgi:hypothetical protein